MSPTGFEAGLRRRMRLAAAIPVVFAATLGTMPARADFPGERWIVELVTVEAAAGGEVSPSVMNAINTELRSASETYFYGDRRVRMIAVIHDSAGGRAELRIVDALTGQELARRDGLDLSGNVSAVALDWMDTLGCGDAGCNVAVAAAPSTPTAPEPEIEVAAAEVTTPAPADPVVEAPTVSESEPAVAPPSEVPAGEPAIAVAEPAVPAAAEPDPVAAEAALPEAPATPSVGVAEAAPTSAPGLAEPTNLATAPVAAAPGAAPQSSAPEGGPSLARAAIEPDTSAPSEQPASGAAPAVAEATGSPTPSIAAPASDPQGALVLAAPVLPDSEEAEPLARAPEAGVQEVAPGLRLPEPTVDQATAPVAAGIVPAVPDTTEPVDSPTRLALAEPAGAEVARPSGAGAAPDGSAIETEVARQPQRSAEPVPDTAPILPAPAGVAEPVTELQPAVQAPAIEPSPTLVNPGLAALGRTPSPGSAEAAVATPAAPVVGQPTEPTGAESSEPETALALAAPPVAEITPGGQTFLPAPGEETTAGTAPQSTAPRLPTPEAAPAAIEPKVETRIATADPTAEGPTLANAQWVGFTPAVYAGGENRPGAWISGPFDRKERTGWITDIATGATTRVTFVWREAGAQSRAALSRDAAKALGIGQGDVANLAVYLPR